MSAPPSYSGTPRELRLPARVALVLDRVKRRHLAFALAEFPVLLVTGLASAWLLQALADRLLHLPWSVRCVLLLLDGLGALVLVERFVVRPWKRRLDHKDAALLIERGIPDFRSSLISAVELTAPEADVPVRSRPLVAKLLVDVEAQVESAEVVRCVVRTDRLKDLATRAAWPVVLALLLFVGCQPISCLLVQRILLAEVALPAATRVVSVTRDMTVDEGGEVLLTAKAEGEVPVDGKVLISWLERPAETLTVACSDQAPGEFSLPVVNLREGFSYRFLLNDGVGEEHHVSVRFRPTGEGLRFVVRPPAYTGLPEAELQPTALKLLDGSTLLIEGTSTRPLARGELRIAGVEKVLPLEVSPVDRRGFRTEITVPGDGWKWLSVHLVSDENVESVKDPVYPVELVRDRAPAVTIHTPRDETSTVIANDTVPVVFEVEDDFGIGSAKLLYRVFRLMPDGSTEEAGEGQVPLMVPSGKTIWRHSFAWNLGLLVPEVSTSYSINFWIEATDNHAGTPATGRSAERTLNVISQQEKRLELLELLGQKAGEIERLYEQQRAVNGRLENTDP